MIGYRVNLRDHNSGTIVAGVVLKIPDLVSVYNQNIISNGSLAFEAFDAWVSTYLRGTAVSTWLCDTYSDYLTKAVSKGIVSNYIIRYGTGGILQSDVPLDIVFSNGSYVMWDKYQGTPRLRYYNSQNTLLYTFTGPGPFAYDDPFILPLPLLNVLTGEIDVYARGVKPGSFTNNVGATTIVYGSSLYMFMYGVDPVDLDDPYTNIPDSRPSGPAQGTGLPANDPVDIPGLPTASAIDTGFISLFNPTLAQVKDLSDYMWTNTLFDINNLKKIFADPMDCILGFNMVPVDVPSGGSANVTIGNLITTVAMNLATSQWVELDCGSVNVDSWLGNYMDYSPASRYSIFLPYIGIQELSTDDVVGKTLSLKYHVDVLSCSCIAFLKCGDSVLYQFSGQCGYSIPVTSTNFSQMIANICSLVVGGAGAIAGGGISAGGVGNIVDSVMGLKPQIHRSGSVGGSTGLMGGQTPYLIMELPNICKPTKQYHYLGYPSFVTKKLGDISGYAEFESVILDGIPCTAEERNMLQSLCEGGIYL